MCQIASEAAAGRGQSDERSIVRDNSPLMVYHLLYLSVFVNLHATCTRLCLTHTKPSRSDVGALGNALRPASNGGPRANRDGGDAGRVRVSPAPSARGLARALSRTDLASSGVPVAARPGLRAAVASASPAAASVVPEDGERVNVVAAANGPTGSLQPGSSRFSSREGSTASRIGGAARLKCV